MKENPIAPRGQRPLFPLSLTGFLLTALLALVSAPLAFAVIYPTWEDNSGNPKRKLRLNIPDSVHAGVVRGIIIHGNGAPNANNPPASDDTEFAEDPELVALAEELGFAIIATAHWYKFDLDLSGGTASSEYNKFVARIAAFATQSGHPELVNAPWIAEGFSNGGQMAYGLNVIAPHKTIVFVANKGKNYNNPLPSAAARATPGLLIAGENDAPDNRSSLANIFANNRALGARWAWVEEENTGHSPGDSYDLIRPFLAECARLRYPDSLSPVAGEPALLPLSETSGWLVDHTTWSNFTQIYAHGAQPGSHLNHGWLPNQYLACLYRAFSSYNKAAGPVTGSPIVVQSELPAHLAFSVTPTGAWTSIELFDGATSLGSIASGNPVSITPSVSTTGYHVYHGVITLSGGAKSATKLLPVFLQEPPDEVDPEPEPALRVLVDFGPGATTTVGGDDANNTWNNFTSNTTNHVISLVDNAGATTGITLTLTDNFTGTQTTGSTSPVTYVADAVRDSHYFDNGKTPQLKISGLDPARVYSVSFLGSRMSTDGKIRSAIFTAQGFGAASSTENNATENIGTVSTIADILPTAAGEIVIDLDDAPSNNTTSKVGYLSVMEITSESVP